jgi:chromate reductase
MVSVKMNKTIISVLGISGSLRRGSFNTALINHAIRLAPEYIRIERFDISGIPLYNEDIRTGPGEPAIVTEFKKKIAEADALLIASPEYNYSVAGVLKNAIDWASRPINTSPFDNKPFGMMSAGGGLGAARAQYHLRQMAVYLNMHPLNKPELFVPHAIEKFDREGNLIDSSIEERIVILLEALYEWTIQLKK